VLDTSVTTIRVLIIEDDPTVGEVVARYLRREGYAVDVEADGAVGLQQALAHTPDLVILDLMLPSLSGLEICRRLRVAAPVPIIMLTARGAEADRIAGLEMGADDYVAKPFSPRELTARVKAVLRRATGPLPPSGEQAVLLAGDLEVDVRSHEVRLQGQPVPLTAKEFDLLAYLASNPRRAFRREALLEAVWGFTTGDTSTVTVHVRRLRAKIEPDPSSPRYVCTVWGVGYRFEP
jgi:DNA-binding response OmpR family regulator